MKRTALNMMLTLVCTAILAAIAVANIGPNLMTAKIPFDFYLGSQSLPAGTYTVSRGGSPSIVIFRNEKTAQSVGVVTNQSGHGNTMNKQAQLSFHRYGDRYFLSVIKQAFSSNCFMAAKSKRENAIAQGAKNLARNQAAPEIVTIAAE